MKRVVSISLGSSSRDHIAEKEFLGEKFVIERRGTNGDIKKAKALYEELDGKVNALGMGGLSLYITAGGKKYYFRQALKMVENVKQTPVVDGGGLKDTLERRVVFHMNEKLHLNLKQKKVLIVCAVDRFGMAESFCQLGSRIVFGDLIFALGLPIPIKTLKGLRRVASVLAPILVNLPFHMVYPVGSKQDQESKRIHNRYYEEADIIAGDYHYIKKNFPSRLEGKIILTNTVTAKDIEKLQSLGVKTLVTTTPELNGRSFATNVMEAVLVAYLDRPLMEISASDYEEVLIKLGIEPRVIHF